MSHFNIVGLYLLVFLYSFLVVANHESSNRVDTYDYQDEQPPPCNPLSDNTCLARNPALAGEIVESFSLISASPYFHYTTCPKSIQYTHEALQLNLNKRFDNPSITSNFYILYGKVEADVQGAPGQGIILSMYLQSDDLDEIDIVEVFGGNPYTVQSNFFIKGNITTYDRGDYFAVALGSPMNRFYRYGCEWTPDRITWSIDGQVVRIVERKNPYGIPELPMVLKFSLWAGGDEANEVGTIDWAGGVTDYSGVPYIMKVRNVRIVDYSTGSEYCYGNSVKLNKWIGLTARQGTVAAGLNQHDNMKEDELAYLNEQDNESELVYDYIDENGHSETRVHISKPQVETSSGKLKKYYGKKIADGAFDREKRFLQYANQTFGSTNMSNRHPLSLATYILFQLVIASLF